MDDLVDRLKAAWAMLNDDGDEYGLCDTLSEAAAALEAAREDAARLAFLASEPVVEGFVGDEKDIYDYACDAAWESGRDEPNEADMLAGLRRMIDAAIDQARGKDGQEVGDG